MKNKLTDLNDHLFAQLERLGDEDLSQDDIEKEVKRADAVVAVADAIIANANTHLKAVQLLATHGDGMMKVLPMLGKPQPAEPSK